ncbi:hypothetical protein F9B85_09995 [Heliorestis acidaminivorans]|uniref:Uncharacterized protein n=1 Tax=Heliorestis acidaminivorans TaxID=553427 RepID=A0A6I0F1C0_9FIRM|nr:hypothetical protein [Heliorestis acidaminivorans]KAB2952134.1 hypothetical protein F9B85_09995 [Heliorestis acidaminivorans]
MYWKNEEHKRRYMMFSVLTGKIKLDCEYGSALYLLAAITSKNAILVSQFIDDEGIDFVELQESSKEWSRSEKAMIQLAANLFTAGYIEADVYSSFYTLDPENTKVALQALSIRFTAKSRNLEIQMEIEV